MKKIPLTKGKVVLVDDEDYDAVSRFKWHLAGKYAARTVEKGTRKLYMHRFLNGLALGDVAEIDHVNGDTLDNRRSNLRFCDAAQNQWNTGARGAGPKGVTRIRGRWVAQIQRRGKHYSFSGFPSAERAHEFYCLAADMLHGAFARYA